VDLDNLRTVRGRVLRADHHPVGQAEVLLTDQEGPVGANAARYAGPGGRNLRAQRRGGRLLHVDCPLRS
jgi:hypothetical protein